VHEGPPDVDPPTVASGAAGVATGRFGRPGHVHPSLDALLAGAAVREPFDGSGDGRSGATFERVVLDGVDYVVKHVDRDHDWTMRAMGDLVGATLELWRRGVLAALPPCIHQPVVAVAKDPALPPGRGIALVMHDVGRWLVPPGDAPLPIDQHLGFLDHMAAVHARFWEAGPDIDLVPVTNRYLDLSPWLPLTEAAIGSTAMIPPLVARGWDALPDVAPALAAAVLPLAWDPSPLAAALATTPSTLLHGNWKFGNLGTDDDGRTVLLDWEGSGRGPACGELAWYLAINSARLPHAKEVAIAAYRAALERHGVDTAGWWDRQLGLALVGGAVQFGWEKALGGPGDELDWWTEAVLASSRFLP
jgi:hypothetical protein